MSEKLTLEKVQEHAKALGLVVEEDHVDGPKGRLEGYWLVCPEADEGPWPDENFSTSLAEVAGKLCAIEYERKYG